ncbi:hypothetical protein [Mycobacterium sp. E3198]|nr:hypothetical protein [Mycobacterium sp. E3198]
MSPPGPVGARRIAPSAVGLGDAREAAARRAVKQRIFQPRCKEL